MIIACIACGGVLETWLVIVGLGALWRWMKKRHKKDRCNCCKEHEHKEHEKDTET